MKALRGFISPWTFGAIALWIVFMATEANVEIQIYINTGDGPEGSNIASVLTPANWMAILGTSIVVATIAIAALAGLVALGRRTFARPWLLAGMVVWVVVLAFAYDSVLGLELFKTYDPPVNGVLMSYTVERQPILVAILAVSAATIVTGLIGGAVVRARRLADGRVAIRAAGGPARD